MAARQAARFSRQNQPFTCSGCGRRAAWGRSNHGDLSTELCSACYDEAGLENEHSDSGHAEPVDGCPLCKPVSIPVDE